MSSGLQFSEEEIQEKLRDLGYNDIPPEKLKDFSRDLQKLIEHEQMRSLHHHRSFSSPESTCTESYLSIDQNTSLSSSQDTGSDQGCFKAFSRERVPLDHQYRPATSQAVKNYSSDKENKRHFIDNNMGQRHKITNYSSSSNDHHTEVQRGNRTACKRKVLRRREGEARVFDESFAESDTGSSFTDISELEQRLRDLPIQGKDVFEIESDDLEGKEPRDYRPWINAVNPSLPSFIRPSTSHPHTRGFRKCDPVNRFHQFQYEWKSNKAPGEKSRKSLRWGVRGQMLQCEMFERPQRNYKPNNYVVPTEKKRQALRWQVRSNMA